MGRHIQQAQAQLSGHQLGARHSPSPPPQPSNQLYTPRPSPQPSDQPQPALPKSPSGCLLGGVAVAVLTLTPTPQHDHTSWMVQSQYRGLVMHMRACLQEERVIGESLSDPGFVEAQPHVLDGQNVRPGHTPYISVPAEGPSDWGVLYQLLRSVSVHFVLYGPDTNLLTHTLCRRSG